MRRGSAGIYKRGGYAYARAGGMAVARAILDAAHEEALRWDAEKLYKTPPVARPVGGALIERALDTKVMGSTLSHDELARILGFKS